MPSAATQTNTVVRHLFVHSAVRTVCGCRNTSLIAIAGFVYFTSSRGAFLRHTHPVQSIIHDVVCALRFDQLLPAVVMDRKATPTPVCMHNVSVKFCTVRKAPSARNDDIVGVRHKYILNGFWPVSEQGL